jgi:hypothetical protein
MEGARECCYLILATVMCEGAWMGVEKRKGSCDVLGQLNREQSSDAMCVSPQSICVHPLYVL